MAKNLRRPPGGVGAFAFGARSWKRLLAATKLIKFYDAIGENLTAVNHSLIIFLNILNKSVYSIT